ncbi:MAG: DNA mismatch repair endonuclease MutL [Planctomycetes bacterium]|nr:DNA mismatch repair endonuclease MutL [Planctomycetota bacterium]
MNARDDSPNAAGSIRVLSAEVVNQIAAGEVIERPFSVVKELVENSLDAGALRIVVELKDGGRELIRVIDDGGGFAPQDLELAFVSHATSKLSVLADLDHIASLGFRGEALASIGSVSRARIRSRRPLDPSGHEIGCDGGAIDELRPSGVAPGTVVEVRDLFFNTPARRRFLRGPEPERARIEELLARLSIPRLDVDFTLIADGKERLRLPAHETLVERAARAFGPRLADHATAVEVRWDEYRVHGLVGSPDLARRDASLSLLWINGRLTKDRGAVHAIKAAYKPFTMHGAQPVHLLLLAMPPSSVDVNVHPSKAEVRFLEPRRACGILHEAATQGLRGHGATAVAGGAVGVAEDKPRAVTGFPDLPRDLFGRTASPSPPAFARSVSEARVVPAAAPNPFARLTERPRFLVVDDLYLVLEIEGGLCVVDQHALHERVLYERLLRQHDARDEVLVQRLLLPEIVEVTPTDKAWLLEHQDELAAEGFLVDDFGGRAVAVHGIPAVLRKASPKRLVESLLAGDSEGSARPRAREAVVERFHSMACRAAVMAGDRLGEDEITALLAAAATLDHPHNCPHGRPTVLRFSAVELERFFKRRTGSCGVG